MYACMRGKIELHKINGTNCGGFDLINFFTTKRSQSVSERRLNIARKMWYCDDSKFHCSGHAFPFSLHVYPSLFF